MTSLFETMSLGVVYQDGTGKIISANPAAERILGLSLDQMQGRTSVDPRWRAVREDGSDFPGDAHPAMVALRTGEVVKGVVMGVRHGRRERYVWISIDAVPCFRPGSKTPHMVYTTFEDMTERRRAQEELRASEERLRLANEIANIGIYEADPRTDAVRWSKQMCSLYGVPEGRVQSVADWMDLVHADDRDQALLGYRRSLDPSGDGWLRSEHRVRLPDGTERTLSWLGRTLAEDGGGGAGARHVGVVMDIGARVEAAALREAARRKDAFLAVLSHELRNPLTPILNGIEVLEHAPAGEEQAQRALAIIKRQATQLAKLVDDLLDVTRLARGKVRLRRETLDLGELVRDAVEDYRASFERAGVQLELVLTNEPVLVEADRSRVAQVVGNLLQNAAKFTARDGRTRVSVSMDRATTRAVLEVSDTGIGIPAELLEHVFEPFSQADAALAHAGGGLGLGLALVRALVELHGGEVRAVSAGLGAGTRLVVTLPLTVTRAEPACAPSRGRTTPRRVLVIEDNEDVAESLRTLLELAGHDVTVAHDGTEGLERARALRPDLVISDLGLPGMSGLEVARALRADERMKRTFLAALSGYAQPQDVAEAAKAGFDRHLAKPPSLEQLEALLSDAGGERSS